MKDCDRVNRYISDYIEGNIDEQTKAVIENHLQKCPNCGVKIEELIKIKKRVNALPQIKTSPHFTAVLHAKIRQENKSFANPLSLFFRSWSLKTTAYATIAILLFMLGAVTQRLVISRQPVLSSQPTSSTVDYVIKYENQGIVPGYMTMANIDSTRNRITIMNFVEVDEVDALSDAEQRGSETTGYGELPDLRNAPPPRVGNFALTAAPQPTSTRAKEYTF